MDKQNGSEKPEVYALRQNGGEWQISRRDFLKAAGIGAAAISAGMSGCSTKEEDLIQVTATPASISDLCQISPAHERIVENIRLSVDDKYLVSGAFNTLKCWDLENFALIGSIGHLPLRDFDVISTGRINGKSCVFGNGNGVENIQYFELPFTDGSEKQNLPVKGYFRRCMILDSSENFYGVNNDGIYYSAAAENYAATELFFKLDGSNYPKSIRLIDHEKKLFVHSQEGGSYGTLDLTDKTEMKFEGNCYKYALTPDGTRALIYDHETNDIRNVSLSDGSVLWTVNGAAMGYVRRNGAERVKGMAVSGDGNHAFLLGDLGEKKGMIRMLSMADGSEENTLTLGSFNNVNIPAAATADGTMLITVFGKSILVISLPDLKISGCLSDVSAMPDTMEGIELSRTDPETGVVYSYTLPGGAEIPEGAVCTCNTVAGKVSTACTCDSHKCSCDAHRSSGSHYWHPN